MAVKAGNVRNYYLIQAKKFAAAWQIGAALLLAPNAFPSAPPIPDNRLIVAFAGFAVGCDGQTSNPPPLLPAIDYSIPQSLAQVKELHLLGDIDSLLQQARSLDPNNARGDQLRNIALYSAGDLVVAGEEQYDGRLWKVHASMLNFKTGVSTNQFIETPSWQDLQAQVTADILQFADVKPAPAEMARMKRLWSVPEPVLQAVCDAIISVSAHPPTQIESNLCAIVIAYPNFWDPYLPLTAIRRLQGNLPAAEALSRKAVALAPDSAATRANLGYTLLSEGKEDEAIAELKTACQYDPDDADTCGMLAKLCVLNDQLSQAIEFYNKGIQANPRGREAKLFARRIAFLSPRQTVFFATNTPPYNYPPQDFYAGINGLLTPHERSQIINPLEDNQQMTEFARQLASGAANELEKARRIYSYTVQLASTFGQVDHAAQSGATAKQVFEHRAEWRHTLFCQPLTFFYVALARAAGLRAGCVDVTVDCDGTQVAHMCAVVCAEGTNLLVDPAYCWFGAPHKKFKIWTDSETAAQYLATAPQSTLEQLRIAEKIAPNLKDVELNLADGLMAANDFAGARQVLARLQSSPSAAAYADALAALLSIHDGDLPAGQRLLERAVATDSSQFTFYAELGDTYLLETNLPKAAAAYTKALSLRHSERDEENLTRRLQELNQPNHAP